VDVREDHEQDQRPGERPEQQRKQQASARCVKTPRSDSWRSVRSLDRIEPAHGLPPERSRQHEPGDEAGPSRTSVLRISEQDSSGASVDSRAWTTAERKALRVLRREAHGVLSLPRVASVFGHHHDRAGRPIAISDSSDVSLTLMSFGSRLPALAQHPRAARRSPFARSAGGKTRQPEPWAIATVSP